MPKPYRYLMLVALAATALLPVAAEAGTTTGFIDVDDSDTFAEPIAWLQAAGIIAGCALPSTMPTARRLP